MPSMPFLKRPSKLDGSLPGGEGCFDPLGFTEVFSLEWLRELSSKVAQVELCAHLLLEGGKDEARSCLSPRPARGQWGSIR